jgi:hypothetical protein
MSDVAFRLALNSLVDFGIGVFADSIGRGGKHGKPSFHTMPGDSWGKSRTGMDGGVELEADRGYNFKARLVLATPFGRKSSI